MDYDFSPLLTKEQRRAYKHHEKEMSKLRSKEVLETYYTDVLNNPDLFDREYYITQLKKKGFKFDQKTMMYAQYNNTDLKIPKISKQL